MLRTRTHPQRSEELPDRGEEETHRPTSSRRLSRTYGQSENSTDISRKCRSLVVLTPFWFHVENVCFKDGARAFIPPLLGVE